MGKAERKEAKIEREESKKVAAKAKAQKDAEDAYWAAHGENDKSKAAKKREEEEKKRAEQVAKKAEAKRLADAELEELSKAKAKAEKAGSQKVTHFQLHQQREFEDRLKEEMQAERDLAARREMSAEQYARQVETENLNRGVEAVDARGVDAALKVLTVKEEEADKHPEKRMKAAWKAYEERNLPILKQDKPGLKMSQYKDMLWKSWQKAPENPLNQVQLASPQTPK
ncbi:hypothetical protein VOLCADRAFT_120131 [Volvox carteri f. nagariensis]|uniref:Coiled-coil domain-containing protein n=1 Tax=Volvox carteri f. nagariensis TaxID=3068 RepID=D8TGY2_VOLCA|nr:uncharacterized protein VOLCADRAFT_120131 [Volvox carteri f. nagariensis]EFJ52978.1 hypothetical protein VOLCADRAFT_120131 [Volvox carteri f. nagariensis]|eukprot:XP_002945983.1 hypothetical protein VOLCADRAFT_120131 [Volvox carteri f. nagariensis]